MRNSRTNSFRLHRISRANSSKKNSQTFYFSAEETVKLPAMNSVSRGVKYNQLSLITGDDLNKLRVEPLETNDYFYQSAHCSLAQTRKKYDQMKKQRVSVDENITKLKADIKKYKTFQGEQIDKINQAKTSAQNLQKSLQEKKVLLEQTIMQKKVLQNMRKRHRSDKVVYDQRKFNLQKEQKFQKTQISIFKRDGYYVGEEFERTQKIYQKLMNQLNAQNVQREQHLKNLEDMIREKDISNKHNVTRQRQIYQIAQRALQDKDPNQKQWNQIYLTNVFVSKMLRNKIDREMEKFSVVEFAFKNIKTATGVSDAKTLIHKFLNKESQYGDLLGRITINQKRISELKQDRDFLLEEQKELQIQKQTLQNMKIKNADLSNELKIFSFISQHEKKMETYMSKMSSWLNKQAKKLNAIEKSSVTFQESRSKNSIKANFIQFCQILSSMLAKCDNKPDSDTATTVTDLSSRDSARVARIQPKKSRKNSVGQQIFDVEEEQLPPANEHEEKEVINSQRQELVKTNQKFMKQARKRLEQKRKLGLQRIIEKKDKKVVQAKKQQG